ncbi:MAG: toll/interleukin-1 receptor domain-containing protein [Fibrobacter sp.]|nr:toll/interleukin-1 receptor domain-containing protein [Fibrobacter sp.]
MPGATKRICNHQISEVLSKWTEQLKKIRTFLPKDYVADDIIFRVKKYFPHEWEYAQFLFEYYKKKDSFLKKRKNRMRYFVLPPEQLILKNDLFRLLNHDVVKAEYSKKYDLKKSSENESAFEINRKPKIDKVNQKIQLAKSHVQLVSPPFLEKLMGLYSRKGTTQKDRMYILEELKKYYSPKVIEFFIKINDTEINQQLRQSAFYHLQSFNYVPRLRSQKHFIIHTKNKKRKKMLCDIYAKEETFIAKCPEELIYRIQNNAPEQRLKTFDYFISHSSKDSSNVQKLIEYENSKGKNVFCDWINDVDYLKRNLVCKETLNVIEQRLNASDALLFVKSENSAKSVWCNYELNYFYELKKPMLVIELDDLAKENFCFYELKPEQFLDLDYKQRDLKLKS